jgi:hypothetical protein
VNLLLRLTMPDSLINFAMSCSRCSFRNFVGGFIAVSVCATIGGGGGRQTVVVIVIAVVRIVVAIAFFFFSFFGLCMFTFYFILFSRWCLGS